MIDRSTAFGSALLACGVVVSALGYVGVQSVPIAVFGFSLSIIGALLLLLVPVSAPPDAFKSLLRDSIANIEVVLEESHLRNRAYFVPTSSGEVRAFVPMSDLDVGANLVDAVNGSKFISQVGGVRGLLLVPPGNEIVKLSKVARGDDLEEALRSALVSFSDLAGSVLLVEEEGKVKIQIGGARLSSDLPYFNDALGSPVSCVASCVVSAAKGQPVRMLDEKFDPKMSRLTLEVVA